MQKQLAAALLAAVSILGISAASAATDPVYPFKVKLNGQEAVKKDANAIFATVSSPVPANAKIEVESNGQVIINAVACDANGTPVQGSAMAVILFDAPSGSLEKTMDGNKLKAGKYLANVVAGGATSRIVFDVK